VPGRPGTWPDTPRKAVRRATEDREEALASRVLIVDDHLAIREGIRSLLAPESDFVVVGEAIDGNDGIEKAIALRPDLIVLDNSMPGKTGLEVARELKPLLPDTSIVFLTLDPGIRDLALAVGAAGHISKDTPPQQMLKVLRNAAQAQERRRNGPPTLTDKERALGQALLDARLLTEAQLETLVSPPRCCAPGSSQKSSLRPSCPA
jgi:DNA-binding NarL/FixJ family response regulator